MGLFETAHATSPLSAEKVPADEFEIRDLLVRPSDTHTTIFVSQRRTYGKDGVAEPKQDRQQNQATATAPQDQETKGKLEAR